VERGLSNGSKIAWEEAMKSRSAVGEMIRFDRQFAAMLVPPMELG
jgi:hypothetical protein